MIERGLSYTSKDYRIILEELLGTQENNYRDGLVAELTDNWTDFRDSDIGVSIVKLMAMIGDMICYNIDQEILEIKLENASQRNNVRNLLQNIGYKMPGYRSAVISDVVIRLDGEYSEDEYVIIDKYISLSTEEGEISYLVNEDESLVLDPNKSVEVECIQGEIYEEERDETDIDGLNKFYLEESKIAEETVEIEIEGEEWEEVDNVLLYAESGRYFSMHYDDYGHIFIRLFAGWRNFYDEDDVNINVRYVVSDGKEGRLGADKLTSVSDEVYNAEGEEVSSDLYIESHGRSFGGYDPQSLKEAKTEGVELAKTMWTAVSINDYETLCRDYFGISNALGLDWQVREDELLEDLENDWDLEEGELAPTEPYIVYIYLVPDEGKYVSSEESYLDDLTEYLDKRKVLTTDIRFKDVYYKEIDIEIELSLREMISRDRAYTVQKQVEQEIEDYFDKKERSFGEIIRYLDIIRLVEGVSEHILSVDLKKPSSNVRLEFVEFPILNSLEVKV